jgi:hypothetical protein
MDQDHLVLTRALQTCCAYAILQKEVAVLILEVKDQQHQLLVDEAYSAISAELNGQIYSTMHIHISAQPLHTVRSEWHAQLIKKYLLRL